MRHAARATLIVAAVCGLAATACSGSSPRAAYASGRQEPPSAGAVPLRDLPDVDLSLILSHTKTLSSDKFEGRAPGTRGEELTVAYLVDQFRAMGLKPGNADGTYHQRVPLVGITPASASLVLKKGGATRQLRWKDDVVAWTRRAVRRSRLEASELVFVGYGVVAPEYGWDDYKGMDVRGKTLVMLINDPPVPSPTNPAELDPKVFGGRGMTYYGRWTYKFEIAAEKEAAGVLIVHEAAAAGYPFSVVQTRADEQLDLVSPDGNARRAAVEGWIALDQARSLFAMAGQDFDLLKARAATRAFRPVPLGVTASMTLVNTLRTFVSQNVVAKLEGASAGQATECVIYTAHWDHLGTSRSDPRINEPNAIYHGAQDNAVGTAGLLEIARAFTRLSVPPKRSVVFLAVTAEEPGLLGSRYYARAPIYPLASTLANINIDGLNVHGRTNDLTLVGFGASELDGYAQEAAKEQGRRVRPDPGGDFGSVYRSDHFSFAAAGIPTLHTDGGTEYVGKPAEYGEALRRRFTRQDYHQASDVVRSDWDLSGAREDLKVLLAVGYRVAQASRYPAWAPGNAYGVSR